LRKKAIEVNTLDLSTQVTFAVPRREPEGELAHARGAGPRDLHRVVRLAVLDHVATAARVEEALRLLAHEHEIDVAGTLVGEDLRQAREPSDRAHAGVEIELHAQVELRDGLRAVWVADVGPAHGAEQDGIGAARGVDRGRG
jgi:hypothetical protein